MTQEANYKEECFQKCYTGLCVSLLHFNIKPLRVSYMNSWCMMRHTSQLCDYTIVTWLL